MLITQQGLKRLIIWAINFISKIEFSKPKLNSRCIPKPGVGKLKLADQI